MLNLLDILFLQRDEDQQHIHEKLSVPLPCAVPEMLSKHVGIVQR